MSEEEKIKFTPEPPKTSEEFTRTNLNYNSCVSSWINNLSRAAEYLAGGIKVAPMSERAGLHARRNKYLERIDLLKKEEESND